MAKFFYLVVLAGLAGGGYYFYHHYEVEGLQNISLKARDSANQNRSPFGNGFVNSTNDAPDAVALPQPERTWIRIASFNFGPVDRKKMAKRHVLGSLAKLVGQFDVVAVQDIRGRDHGLLLMLIDELNAAGRHFDFASWLPAGHHAVTQYNAFLYDKQTIEIDPSTVCQVRDESNRFRRAPLVASFRTRGPDAKKAFTFTLINVHVDSERATTELNLLDDIFRAVRDDGRGEDDVILLGHLAADERHLGELASIPNISATVSRLLTNTRGTRMDCNLLFDRVATVEYTGRSDVLDFMRNLELSLPEALEVSEHLPVWAEFSVFEGGQPGLVSLGQRISTR